jgi:ferredoxin
MVIEGRMTPILRRREAAAKGLDIWPWGSDNSPHKFTETTMADIANKYPDNVAGKYYVDNQCIDCDLCRETAPNNFQRNEDGGYSFVFKQPENDEEEAQCKEAKEGCPVEAIGDNGT